jgi:hypothetical protein
MQLIKPESPNQQTENRISVFLAGSIEMGKAEDWQVAVEKELKEFEVTVFNPRRNDWDSSWEQKESSDQFNYQVNWELNRLEESTVVFMYFSPGTQSPISLLELGAFAGRSHMVVCCPTGFWRKGNVDIFCTRANVPVYENFEDAVGALKTKIRQYVKL